MAKRTEKARRNKKKAGKKGGRGGGRGEDRGLMSSAGLMRYYDTDESVVKVSPRTLVLISVFIAVIILALEIYYGVWPI